jgi:hypothetical protein
MNDQDLQNRVKSKLSHYGLDMPDDEIAGIVRRFKYWHDEMGHDQLTLIDEISLVLSWHINRTVTVITISRVGKIVRDVLVRTTCIPFGKDTYDFVCERFYGNVSLSSLDRISKLSEYGISTPRLEYRSAYYSAAHNSVSYIWSF